MKRRNTLIAAVLAAAVLLAASAIRAQQPPPSSKPQQAPPAAPPPGQQGNPQSGQTFVREVNLVDVLFTVLNRRHKLRSEERRVGKEFKCMMSPYCYN